MPTSGAEIGQKRQWNPFEILINMRREAPEFKRCCLCLPLRRGVITWGYIKLALVSLAAASLINVLDNGFIQLKVEFFLTQIVFFFIDAAFNIVLIVGGHQKSVGLLKVAYICNMVDLGLLMASCTWAIYLEFRLCLALPSYGVGYKDILRFSLLVLSFQFILIFVQIYLVLLIRSEKQKLEEQSLEMQFSNPSAAEAQCTMHAAVGRSDVSDRRSDGVQCTGDD